MVKINFDGTLFSKEKKFGIGMVAKDDNGSVLASCTKSLSQAYNAIEIESMTATTTLSFAHYIGIMQTILEGDSLAMIKALKEDVHSLAPTSLLIEDVRILSQNFDQLLYSHTKREGNSMAHSLTRYAIGIPDFLVWMEDVPPHIRSVLQVDLVCYINKVLISPLKKKKKKNHNSPIIITQYSNTRMERFPSWLILEKP